VGGGESIETERKWGNKRRDQEEKAEAQGSDFTWPQALLFRFPPLAHFVPHLLAQATVHSGGVPPVPSFSESTADMIASEAVLDMRIDEQAPHDCDRSGQP
jgi:hypothetical protein